MAKQTNRIVIGVIVAVIVIVPLGLIIGQRFYLPAGGNDILIEVPSSDVRRFAVSINATEYEIGDTSPYHSALTSLPNMNRFYRSLNTEEAIIKELFGIKQSLEYDNGTKKIFHLYDGPYPDPANPTNSRYDAYTLFYYNGNWWFRVISSSELSSIVQSLQTELDILVTSLLV